MINELEKYRIAAQNYFKARKEFLEIAGKSEMLFGSDNFVGRIGEFVAFQYLLEHNRLPKRPESKTEKGFDFICDNGKTKVSVKTITYENKIGSTTVIVEPWDELFIITINENLKIDKFGIITKSQIKEAYKKGYIKSQKPYARKSMLNKKGIISVFGTIINQEITNKYL